MRWQQSQKMERMQEDPHKWLEDVLGDEPMKWVKSKNEEVIAAVGDPAKTTAYARILAILDSKDKIPNLHRIGNADGQFYNYWQDDVHVQGIWRKTTLDSYRRGSPEWKTVIGKMPCSMDVHEQNQTCQYIYVNMYTSTHMNVHTCMYICMCVCVCVFVCVCAYIHLYIFVSSIWFKAPYRVLCACMQIGCKVLVRNHTYRTRNVYT